jgi:superfamily II DNA or RNA helicase
VYVYSLKEGINDGFLTPFKVKVIQTTLDKYIYTSEDELLEGEVEEGRAGNRNRSFGALDYVGSSGNYWSSTVNGANANNLGFNSSIAGMDGYNRAHGFSVRCLKD